MKINELDYKEIGTMLSEGYYDIYDKNRLYWNSEEFDIFTERIFFINNILIDGYKFKDEDDKVLLESLYEVYDYVIENKMKYIKLYNFKQDIDEIILCLRKYVDDNF